MTSRWLRGTAFAALVVVLVAAVLVVLGRERHIRAALATTTTIDRAGHRAIAAAYDIRAAQQGYVAAAQSPEWWHGRLASHVHALRRDLGSLRQLASDPSALNDLDAASASLETLIEVDGRALRLVTTGRSTEASLLVFSEGFDAVSAIVQRVDSARSAEAVVARARVMAARLAQAYACGGTAALVLLIATLLLPNGRPGAAGAAIEEPAMPHGGGVAAVSSDPDDDILADAPLDGAPSPDHGSPVPVPEPDQAAALRAAADLCTEFARVSQATELPVLLGRAADLLDASGLIIWLPDTDGLRLRPSLAHGYAASALARLPVIDRDADNATALSFRRAEPHVVEGHDGGSGAIVVPLLTASGCVGVLAAEVLGGREAAESTRSMARLLAAQISTLVGGGDPAREEVAPGHQAAG